MGDVENPMQVRPSPGGTEKVAEPSTNAQDEHEQAKSLPGEALPHKLSWYKLHEPIPVSDVLFLKPRTIILLRYVVHMSIALSKIVFLPVALLLIPLLVIIRPLLRRKWPEAAKAISFPAIYFKFEHILWRDIFSRFLLRDKKSAGVWWFGHLILSKYHEFERDYIEAWKEQASEHGLEGKPMAIFLGDERLITPRLEGDDEDRILLKNLRMFCRLLKIRRGLSELIIPKKLARIDLVRLDSDSNIVCEKIKTLELGHESGSSIAFFHKPDLAKTDRTVATHFSKYGTKIGVEFVRKYNRAAVAGVVSALPLGSLIFATIWMAIYLREPEELQAKITTAFTVSTYLMTTGALAIALVAYLDVTIEDGDPKLRASVEELTHTLLPRDDERPMPTGRTKGDGGDGAEGTQRGEPFRVADT